MNRRSFLALLLAAPAAGLLTVRGESAKIGEPAIVLWDSSGRKIFVISTQLCSGKVYGGLQLFAPPGVAALRGIKEYDTINTPGIIKTRIINGVAEHTLPENVDRCLIRANVFRVLEGGEREWAEISQNYAGQEVWPGTIVVDEGARGAAFQRAANQCEEK